MRHHEPASGRKRDWLIVLVVLLLLLLCIILVFSTEWHIEVPSFDSDRLP